MQYRVMGYVFKDTGTKGERRLCGRAVFQTTDYEAGDWFARNLHRVITDDCHVNVDHDVALPIGRGKTAWVDADPVEMDRIAQLMLEEASNIRAALKGRGKVRSIAFGDMPEPEPDEV